jgi:hypothetical protein
MNNSGHKAAMSVLKLKYVLPALLAIVLGGAIDARAQYDPVETRIDSLGSRVDSLVVVQQTLAELRAGMLVRASDLSARIDRLRTGSGGPLAPLDKYRLSSALALSQGLADSLDLANMQIDELQQEIDGLKLDAVSACTAALDSLSRLMKDSPAGPRGMLATRFERLRESRQRFASVDGSAGPEGHGQGEGRMSLSELAGLVEIRPHDSPEEIAEKSSFLTDIEIRWSRSLQALEHNIGRLDEEHAMRGRMGEFTQELALFDQTGPSSRAAVVPGSVNDGQERSDGGEQPTFGGDRDNLDYSSNAKQMAESISLDIELADPETELRLIHELDRFSNVDITDLASLLRARRDSLAAELDSLRELHDKLSSKADLD